VDSARTPLSLVHRWTGLCAGLLFILVALTGAGLAWRAQLEPVVSPGLLAGPACAAPLPLDALVERARAANPGAGPLKAIRLYGQDGAAVRVRFSDAQWVYVSPCGAVSGIQGLYGGPFGTLAWLHIFGSSGAGDLFAGSLATLFAGMMLGAGALLWKRPSRAAVRTLPIGRHKAIALFAAPVLLVSAMTGIPQAFKWGALPPAALAAPGGAPMPLAQLLARVEALLPGAQKIQVKLPPDPTHAVVFEVVAHDAPHANAASYLHLDPASGAVLLHVPHEQNRLAHKAYLLAAAIHYGWAGGWPVQLLLTAAALCVPVLAWTGVTSWLRRRRQRPLMLRVAARTSEGLDACAFELVHPTGRALPRFTAGAHLDVHIAPGLVRQYSLCNSPADSRRYQICVLKTPDSRGGSRAMHEIVQHGGVLSVSAPRNNFPLVPDARRSLLFAGGIGITPILAMAEHLSAGGADFALHYCARSAARAPFRERIANSAFARKASFHYSDGGQHADLAALVGAPESGTHLYVCGPAGFMDAVFAAAIAQGWNEAQLHREYFAGAAQSGPDAPFDLRIASSGKLVHVAAGVTALEALAASGIVVPSSCGQGVCGTCVTGVLAGEPEHRDRVLSPDQQGRNDCFTPCCSRARSAVLTVDL
jgi:ferredoxin-NADP reductase